MDPDRLRRLADRTIAIEMAIDGASFLDVYRFFVASSDDPAQSFENTRRVFRGGVLTGGAPFTKDGVYIEGLLRVHNFLRACLGQQPAMPDAETSVNWTMVGICAHQSALKGGEKIVIPRF